MFRLSMKGMMLLLFLGVLVFSMTAPAIAAAGAQNWYLDSTDHPALPTVGKVMEKGPAAYGNQSDSVTIAGVVGLQIGSQIWLADEVAKVDVTFPNGAWVIHLKTDGFWGGAPSPKCVIDVGEWDVAEVNPSLKFKPFLVTEKAKLTWDNGKHIMRVDLQIGPQTVHKGNYLALMVINLDNRGHTVYTTGRSFVESPGSDPGYPVPEIAAGVLLGLGLAGLLGYVAIRGRAKARAKA